MIIDKIIKVEIFDKDTGELIDVWEDEENEDDSDGTRD